jgi:hypothetical protein
MYHVELRQFPHNFCRFNLTKRELTETILEAWARGDWLEVGERKWSPHQANLTVLEGPRLPVEELSMGRGWRNAKRQGKDVTAELLAAVGGAGAPAAPRTAALTKSGPADAAESQALTGAGAAPPGDRVLDVRLAGDSLGLEALARLGEGPTPVAGIWKLARERYPEHSASDCLKLAEHAIYSLAQARLVVVLSKGGSGELEPCIPREQVERALRAVESWSGAEGLASVLIQRA